MAAKEIDDVPALINRIRGQTFLHQLTDYFLHIADDIIVIVSQRPLPLNNLIDQLNGIAFQVVNRMRARRERDRIAAGAGAGGGLWLPEGGAAHRELDLARGICEVERLVDRFRIQNNIDRAFFNRAPPANYQQIYDIARIIQLQDQRNANLDFVQDPFVALQVIEEQEQNIEEQVEVVYNTDGEDGEEEEEKKEDVEEL